MAEQQTLTEVTTAARRSPGFGDTVRYDGGDATVVKVRPTGTLDLLTYGPGGKPTAHDRVEHDLETGWSWPEELPSPPPTLAELLDQAEAQGQRVPRPGMEVLSLQDMVDDGIHQDVIARRARVVRPTRLDEADLEIFVSHAAPDDPDDDDHVFEGVIRRVGHDPSGNRPCRYAYIEDGFRPQGRVRVTDARPRFPYERPGCSKGADPGHGLQIPGGRLIRTCPSCHARWSELVADFAEGKEPRVATATA